MALDCQLNPPFIILIATDSINTDIIEISTKDLQFGRVTQVNYANMHVDVNDTVLFNKSTATQMNQSGQTYFIVDESEVLFTQNPLL